MLLMVALTTAACGGLPPSPSVPSSLPAPSVSLPPAPPSVVDPAPPPTGLQPTIAGISPNVVSTAGTWGTITGAQFESGATVKIANAAVLQRGPRQHHDPIFQFRCPCSGAGGCRCYQSGRTCCDAGERLYIRGS